MKKLISTILTLLLVFIMSFNSFAGCTDGPAPNTGWCTLDQNGEFICQSFGGCSCTCDGNSGQIDPTN